MQMLLLMLLLLLVVVVLGHEVLLAVVLVHVHQGAVVVVVVGGVERGCCAVRIGGGCAPQRHGCGGYCGEQAAGSPAHLLPEAGPPVGEPHLNPGF